MKENKTESTIVMFDPTNPDSCNKRKVEKRTDALSNQQRKEIAERVKKSMSPLNAFSLRNICGTPYGKIALTFKHPFLYLQWLLTTDRKKEFNNYVTARNPFWSRVRRLENKLATAEKKKARKIKINQTINKLQDEIQLLQKEIDSLRVMN